MLGFDDLYMFILWTFNLDDASFNNDQILGVNKWLWSKLWVIGAKNVFVSDMELEACSDCVLALAKP